MTRYLSAVVARQPLTNVYLALCSLVAFAVVTAGARRPFTQLAAWAQQIGLTAVGEWIAGPLTDGFVGAQGLVQFASAIVLICAAVLLSGGDVGLATESRACGSVWLACAALTQLGTARWQVAAGYFVVLVVAVGLRWVAGEAGDFDGLATGLGSPVLGLSYLPLAVASWALGAPASRSEPARAAAATRAVLAELDAHERRAAVRPTGAQAVRVETSTGTQGLQ